jgi:glutathione synthase/RimK-type ligase-like ATP-grasp enzyme
VDLTPEVLILTNKLDISADLVVLEFHSRGVPFLRINAEDFPSMAVTLQLPARQWTIVDRVFGRVNLSELKSVWFRRPGKPLEDDPSLTLGEREFVIDQWRMLLAGLLAIPGVKWVNDPVKNSAAESKILQLSRALDVGLDIPTTWITNDVTSLPRDERQLIAKCVGSPLVQDQDKHSFVFTTEVKLEDVNGEELRLAPVIFQERLWPKVDYRVTVVEDTVLAARLVENDGKIDWRTILPSAKFEPATLPDSVASKLREIVSRLGLIFGAIDIVFAANRYYFLEVNPNGEWGWLQTTADLPIASALVDALCRP